MVKNQTKQIHEVLRKIYLFFFSLIPVIKKKSIFAVQFLAHS